MKKNDQKQKYIDAVNERIKSLERAIVTATKDGRLDDAASYQSKLISAQNELSRLLSGDGS